MAGIRNVDLDPDSTGEEDHGAEHPFSGTTHNDIMNGSLLPSSNHSVP